MRRAAIVLALFASPAQAGERIERAPSPPVRVQLDSMPLGALATVLMRDIMGVPYVIDADVLKDSRPVSVNLVMPREDIPVRVVRYLRGLGLSVTLQQGTVFVSKRAVRAPLAYDTGSAPGFIPDAMAPMGSPQRSYSAPTQSGDAVAPPHSEAAPDGPENVAVVVPAHRAPVDLVDMVTTALPAVRVAARKQSEPDGPRADDKAEPDALVMAGPVAELVKAVQLVQLLDKPRPMVDVRAVVLEVRSNASKASALSILAKLGPLSAQTTAPTVGDAVLRFATGGFSAVLAATKGDGRFKVVAEPALSIQSGAIGTIKAGSQVPTIGSVTYSDNGTPVRSIVYRDSGVMLQVKPVVRAGGIELSVTQERSSFARTNTGVDDTPTLNTASASAKIALASGESVAIAGLDERTESTTKSGFLGGLLGARSSEKGNAQLLLLISAETVAAKSGAAPAVEFIGAPLETADCRAVYGDDAVRCKKGKDDAKRSA